MKRKHKRKEYRHRLFMATAAALGYYMYARMNGREGEVQLARYKRLGKALRDYDEAHR